MEPQITPSRVFYFAWVLILTSATLVALLYTALLVPSFILDLSLESVGALLLLLVFSLLSALLTATVTFPACLMCCVICFLLFGERWWKTPLHLERRPLAFRAVTAMILSVAPARPVLGVFMEAEAATIVFMFVLVGAGIAVLVAPFFALRIFQPAARG